MDSPKMDAKTLVKRLYDAFNDSGFLGTGGTDEDGVFAALKEARDQGMMREVDALYHKTYPEEPTLREELDDELSGDDLAKALGYYDEGMKGPVAKKPPDPAAAPRKNNHCDGTLTPKAGQVHPPCDPKVNVKKDTKSYGISISPESKLSACQFVQMIKRNTRLEPWIRDIFWVNSAGNRIVVTPQFKMPAGASLPTWLKNALLAFEPEHVAVPAESRGSPYLRNWHVTTGVVNVDKGELMVSDRIRGDFEKNDIPSGIGGRVKSASLITGLTLETKGDGESPGFYALIDGLAGGTKRGKAPHYRLPILAGESRYAEGLIIVADRFCSKDRKKEAIRTNEDAILETLFHELAAHAGRISQGLSSDHGPLDFHKSGDEALGDVDILAKRVYEFFGKQDETCLLDSLR